jgi:hypothetical protein
MGLKQFSAIMEKAITEIRKATPLGGILPLAYLHYAC